MNLETNVFVKNQHHDDAVCAPDFDAPAKKNFKRKFIEAMKAPGNPKGSETFKILCARYLIFFNLCFIMLITIFMLYILQVLADIYLGNFKIFHGVFFLIVI